MIEEILPNLYRIEIPLPRNPLRALNSYAIKSPERSLIIDTGWNEEACMNAMQAGLKKLAIDIEKSDFFITHLHADHMGLLSRLTTERSTIYFNQPDADRFNSGPIWDEFLDYARLNGFPEDELQAVFRSHPGFKFKSEGKLPFSILKEDDTVAVGEYRFRCIATPGHTRGHMCLYEPEKKVLVSGDHILRDITPTIQLWSDEWNSLEEYLASLGKVYKYDVELVLPGHRSIFRNCWERIEELKNHHQERLREIISILESGPQNAFQVASQMSWDITYDSWDLFPVSQKWFAIGEAISHLRYLEAKGTVERRSEAGKRVFSTH
jgi:glyoxylase-like metal-dependent hydrolase (beta-lactamase superfamily II)